MSEFGKERFGSGSEERETPESLFGPLNEEFGFTLDVAASRENAKCANYFDKEKDALPERSWNRT